MNRDFKGIWIPKELFLNSDLKLIEKLFLTEIVSLDGVNGCYASNSYFSDFFDLSKTRCSAIIKNLKEKGYIRIRRFYEDGKKNLERRIIRVNREFIKTKCDRKLSGKYRCGKPKESEANIEIKNTEVINSQENEVVDVVVDENSKEIEVELEEVKSNKGLELSEESCENIDISEDNKEIELVKYNENYKVEADHTNGILSGKIIGMLIDYHIIAYLNTS